MSRSCARSNFRSNSVASMMLVAALLPGGARAADDLRLGNPVVPTRESLRLVLDADKSDYTGSAHLDLRVGELTASFRMHAEDMTITRILLQPLSGSGKPQGAVIAATSAPAPTGLVVVTPEVPLAPGRFALDIDFTNDLNDVSTKPYGLYRITHDDHRYLFTQFETDDAREAFPCFDEPGFKIPWELTAVVPEEQVVLFNTPIARESRNDGTRTVVFQPTPPLPSYLVALAVGPLETVDIPDCGVPARIVTVHGQSALAGHAVQITPQILHALETWFGAEYPFEKLDLLAVPSFAPSAMENPGAVTFLDRYLVFETAKANVSRRRWLARLMAHELAHMWFGNKVTTAWWDDLWLNESLASWMSNKVTAQLYPEFEIATRVLFESQSTMTGDADPSAVALHHKAEVSENGLQIVSAPRDRGHSVLGMLEQWLGPENFRRGVLDYLDRHAWGNATAADLWAALSEVSGQDVSGIMETFTDQPGLPLVQLEPQPDGSWLLLQSRFHSAGVKLPAQTWKIPISLEYSDGSRTHSETVLLATESQTWRPTGPVAWVLPNANAVGHYRWSLPQADLDRLMQNPAAIMQPIGRIGFLCNLGALFDAGIVPGEQYLAGLERFAADPEPWVIAALVDGMKKANESLRTPDLEKSLAGCMRRTLEPSLERWGREPTAGEPEAVTLVRRRILEVLATPPASPESKRAPRRRVPRSSTMTRKATALRTSKRFRPPALVSCITGFTCNLKVSRTGTNLSYSSGLERAAAQREGPLDVFYFLEVEAQSRSCVRWRVDENAAMTAHFSPSPEER